MQTMIPEEFRLHCPVTEERATLHLWAVQHLRVYITGLLGPSEEGPSSPCELGMHRVGGPGKGTKGWLGSQEGGD